MLIYPAWYRSFGVRRFAQLSRPVLSLLTSLELPRNAIVHYPPSNDLTVGPEADDVLIRDADRTVYVDHVLELVGDKGPPRPTHQPPMRFIKDYHRRNRRLKLMRNMTTSIANPRNILVENYGVLPQLFRYSVNFFASYYKWHNLRSTLWSKVNELAKTTEHQQYIPCTLPDVLPTLSQLRRGETKLDRNTLEWFGGTAQLNLLDVWMWLGAKRSETPMGALSADALDHINLIWTHGDRWCVMNLGVVNLWRGVVEGDPVPGSANGLSPDVVQKHFLRSLMSMVESQSEAQVIPEVPVVQSPEPTTAQPAPEVGLPSATDTLAALKVESTLLFEEDLATNQGGWDLEDLDLDAELDALNALLLTAPTEVAEVVQKDTFETQGYAAGVLNRANVLADQGQLSGGEYKRFLALAESYKTIANPYGTGTLAEHAVITPELLQMGEATTIPDIPGVLDKTMLQSSLIEFDTRYIEQVLSKDVVNSVLSVQNAGIAVADYKLEVIQDLMNHYESHTVKLVPLSGQPSTIRFRIPVVQPDGSYRANGVKYRLRKQRGERPIRKAGPARVALTSYYGKNFVERSTKRVNAYGSWLTNQIQAAELAEGAENVAQVHDVQSSPVYNPRWKVPKVYSTLSQRFRGFWIGKYEFYLDWATREAHFGPEEVAAAETSGFTVIGRIATKLVVVDQGNALYLSEAQGLKDIGTIEDLLQLNVNDAPLEQAELIVFSKAIPLGLVLGYYIGLDAMLERLRLQNFRKVPTGERLNLNKGEFAVRFSDEAYVFHRDEPMAVLLFSGFDQYFKAIRRYNASDFNAKDVYLNVLDSSGLGIRYLRELDMLQNMFVDSITRDLLVEMNEPTDWVGLMFRSAELLLTDYSPAETDMTQMRIKGYERVAGQVYTELSKAVRVYNARIGAGNNKVEMSPSTVWTAIQEDAAKGAVEESNPIQNLREQEVVTYGGTGGRSRRSMVKGSRVYDKSDEGVISEATVDSGDVAIISYLTANPNFNSLRGTTKPFNKAQGGAAQLLSTAALLAPESTRDDPKRTNFVGIQHGSAIMAKGCVPSPLRTGYEQVLSHRVGDLFAYTAKADGVVVASTGKALTVEYADGKTVSVETGRRFGTSAGSTFPHEIVSRVETGQKFKAGEVLTYNTNYFQPDPLNPSQVLWRAGILASTAVLESADTLEDSSVISERVAELLTTQATKLRDIVVRFDQHIHALVKVGAETNPETILCTIEDAATANNDLFDQDSLETLQHLGSQVPAAKYAGKVERIEVFYNGDFDDMSPSLRALAEAGDREEAKLQKSLGRPAYSRRVDSTQRIDGNPLEIDQFAIRVFITADVPAGVGDKGVFGSQLKTIFGRVMSGVNQTEAGQDLDAIFAYQSISNRIVNSPQLIGTTNTNLKVMSKRMAEIYST